jgi:integral membrane protein (TIGR00529 family)
MATLKLALLFASILILTRLRIGIGLAIGIGAIIAGLLFGMAPLPLAGSVWKALADPETWELLVVLVSVSFLGSLLKESGLASQLTGSVETLLRSKRASMAILPAMIGLLPMPGGALLSAPLVHEAGSRTSALPTHLASINYWFRHVLEYIWPLYPGIVLTSSLLGISAGEIVRTLWPMSLGMVVGGTLFLLLPLRKTGGAGNGNGVAASLKSVIVAMWPVLLSVVLALGFGVELYLAVPLSILGFVLLMRFSAKIMMAGAKRALTFDYVSFVFTVMIFKQIFVDSRAADILAAEIAAAGIDPIWAIMFVPFVIGLISGATPAFVSLSYPALMSFLKPVAGVDHGVLAIAYCAGYMGVLLSPLHLCFVLTADYFKTTLPRMYLHLLAPLAVMVACCIAQVFLL